MTTEKDETRHHVYLQDRMKHWHNYLEAGVVLVWLSFVLFVAIAWTGGFWEGLWYAVRNIG